MITMRPSGSEPNWVAISLSTVLLDARCSPTTAKLSEVFSVLSRSDAERIYLFPSRGLFEPPGAPYRTYLFLISGGGGGGD